MSDPDRDREPLEPPAAAVEPVNRDGGSAHTGDEAVPVGAAPADRDDGLLIIGTADIGVVDLDP